MTRAKIEQSNPIEGSIQSQVERLAKLEAIVPADPFPDEMARPCWRVYDQWLEKGGKKFSPGVYRHETRIKGRGEDQETQLIDIWVCDLNRPGFCGGSKS